MILDLDTLARSGASADAGNFLAYLDLTGLRRPRLRKALAALRAAFLDALPEADSPWLPWYQATSHLKIGLRSFRSLDPAWPRLSTDLLHCADAALDRLPTQARKVAAC